MIYDEKLRIIVFIQITINENHTEHFELIWNLIDNKNPVCTREEKNLAIFFQDLRKTNLISIYAFQWLTNEKFKKLEKKKKSFLESKDKKKVAEKFQIFSYSEEFITKFKMSNYN